MDSRVPSLGGIIGHQNDETPEGALIGGAVGAIAGGLIGDAKDQEVARQRYYRHQAYHQHQQAFRRAVTIQDVVSMSRNGLSESVILNQIRQHGVSDAIGTHEIISMHNQGVSERVITAMQTAPRAGVSSRETVVVERPARPRHVIVHQEYVVPAPRVRYVTRPAFPTYPSPYRFHRYW